MKIVQVPIYSSSSLDAPEPWFEFDMVGGDLKVRGNHSKRTLTERHSRLDSAISDHAKKLGVSKDEHLLVMLTLDDEVVILPISEVSGDYRAHLGEYDPTTDTLKLLVFVEE